MKTMDSTCYRCPISLLCLGGAVRIHEGATYCGRCGQTELLLTMEKVRKRNKHYTAVWPVQLHCGQGAERARAKMCKSCVFQQNPQLPYTMRGHNLTTEEGLERFRTYLRRENSKQR